MIQRNGNQSSLENTPAFERGREDAREGYSPLEGNRPYLEGYAAERGSVVVPPLLEETATEER